MGLVSSAWYIIAPGSHTPTPAVPRDRTSRPPHRPRRETKRNSRAGGNDWQRNLGVWDGGGVLEGISGELGVYGKLIFLGVLFWRWVWYK